MIRNLTGKVIAIEKEEIIVFIEQNNGAGVGYGVKTTATALAESKIGSIVSFWTYYRGREDGVDIFGFLEHKDLQLFELLLTVSGVGPKSALQIISSAGYENIAKAINLQKVEYLKVPGIGNKTAEKIVLELKDNKNIIAMEYSDKLSSNKNVLDQDLFDALAGLGYKKSDIQKALQSYEFKSDNLEGKIKEILQRIL